MLLLLSPPLADSASAASMMKEEEEDESSLRKACLCLKFLALTWLDSNSLAVDMGTQPRAQSEWRSRKNQPNKTEEGQQM